LAQEQFGLNHLCALKLTYLQAQVQSTLVALKSKMTVIHQVDKDRRSRMPNSSVNQPSKKGGGGGSFNWGAFEDYGPTDVQTCMPREATLVPSKVMVVPAPQVPDAATVSAQTMPAVTDSTHFPSLSPQSVAPQPAPWGPATASAPSSAKMSADQLRQGSEELFNAQHPRNQFARKPRTSSPAQVSAGGAGELQPQYAIDWSAPGTTGVSSTILHQSANPAHLSPYIKAEPPVLLGTLKQLTQQSATKLLQQQPQLCKHSSMGRPVMSRQPGMVLQARGR